MNQIRKTEILHSICQTFGFSQCLLPCRRKQQLPGQHGAEEKVTHSVLQDTNPTNCTFFAEEQLMFIQYLPLESKTALNKLFRKVTTQRQCLPAVATDLPVCGIKVKGNRILLGHQCPLTVNKGCSLLRRNPFALDWMLPSQGRKVPPLTAFCVTARQKPGACFLLGARERNYLGGM